MEKTGFFSPEEEVVAQELVEERLEKGEESGYFFLFAEVDGAVMGYTCFGPVPATLGSYDLYWIAVDPGTQGRGIGRRLLTETERLVREAGGRRIYVETSSRPQYVPTRRFYEQNGYFRAAFLEDFYAPGDGKVIFQKSLS